MRVGFFICFFCMSALFADEFETFMGKESDHWKHVGAKEIEALEPYKALYEKNKAYLSHAAPVPHKIPKVVHFIWLGPKSFPPQSVENIRTWMGKNRDWKVKFWTDRDRPAPCRGMERVFVKDFQFLKLKHCFETSKNFGEQSDILRYEILFQEGGAYADHDANCLVSFDALHGGFDFYCGLETPHPPFAGCQITSGNGVIGSRAGHPVIGKIIDLIAERWETLGKRYRGRDGFSKTELVMRRTYIALTDALKETVDKEGNTDIVLPSAYFFSKKGIPSLYSKHFYANAWANSGANQGEGEKIMHRKIGKALSQSRRIYTIALGLIGLNAALLTLFLIRMKHAKT